MKINAPVIMMVLIVFGTNLCTADDKSGLKSPPITYVSIDEYVELALKQSDRALTSYNSYQNSVLGNKIDYRQLWFPTLSVASGVSKDKSDVNSAVTKGESANGSATLTQPLYPTGGTLSANYSGSTNRTETDPNLVTHSYTRPAYSATFTQPLFLFVGNTNWRTWKRSKLSFDIATDLFKTDLLAIENDARAKYYNVLLTNAQLGVEKTKLESAKQGHAITKALVDAGRLAGIELSRSNLRLQQDIRRYKNAETVYQQSINDALEFVSLKIDTKVVFTSKLDYQPLTLSLDQLINHALDHRPDYIAAKRRLELGELTIKETEESNNPNLNAVASVSKSDVGSGSPPDTVTKSWSGGISLTWNFFDSGITSLRIRQARNDLANEKVAFVGLERNIRTEVSNAFLDVKRTEQQLDDLKTSKLQALQSVDAVRIRYQNGRDRLIDVFDSEQQLRDLELEYLNILISARSGKDRLAVLVGSPLEEVSK